MFEVGSLVAVWTTTSRGYYHHNTGDWVEPNYAWLNARVTAFEDVMEARWYTVELLEGEHKGTSRHGFLDVVLDGYDMEHPTMAPATVYVKMGNRILPEFGNGYEDVAISWGGTSYANAVDLALLAAHKENLSEGSQKLLLAAADTLREGRTWESEDKQVRFYIAWSVKYPHPFY